VVFATLQQGEKIIVMEYTVKFIELSRFRKHLVDT